jgi:pimeloyl-ACP methyl ester carboxylesterase
MIHASSAQSPPKASPLGFKSWAGEMRALAACHAKPPCFPSEALPRGDGKMVMALPGFLTGDWAMARHRAFLRSRGFNVVSSGISFNPGPTKKVINDLDERLMRWSDRAKGPISLVGASLGGVFARAMAIRFPDRVDRVVTLCSPIRFPVTTSLAPAVWALEWRHDPEFKKLAPDVARNPQAPVLAIYSTIDGIVDWRSCLQDEDATHHNLRIDGAHTTIGSNPLAQAAAARALCEPL